MTSLLEARHLASVLAAAATALNARLSAVEDNKPTTTAAAAGNCLLPLLTFPCQALQNQCGMLMQHGDKLHQGWNCTRRCNGCAARLAFMRKPEQCVCDCSLRQALPAVQQLN